MTPPDIIAQFCMAGLMLLAVTRPARRLLDDCADGNIDRLEREERNRDEARMWLAQMEDRG